MSITLNTLQGNALQQYLPDLARLRISVFRNFPYLYDGDLAYEEQYLQTYIQCPDAAIIIAQDGQQVIGASTCLPMRDEDPAFQQAFVEQARELKINIQHLFYCGESVLDQRYRGQGIGVAFFQHREAHATQLGGFTHSCFCAVDRPESHPLRPNHYVPLDQFWIKRGYQKQPQLKAHFVWKDIDQDQETSKSLTFWLKTL